MKPLRLEQYFFTKQEVRANPTHDQSKNKLGSVVNHHCASTVVEGRPNTLAVECSIMLDEAQSDNPPYFFSITAFGVFTLENEKEFSDDRAKQMATAFGLQVLIGAIREQIAALTSRGPWGVFLLNIFTVNVERDTAQPDGPQSDTASS